MEPKVWDEQKRWDEEKWLVRKESVYYELFFRKEQEGERHVSDITEKDVELMREGIGVRHSNPVRVFNADCNRDNLRHLAQGNGDPNPLYYDAEYAKETRWGGLIAPPAFLYTTGTTLSQEGQQRRTAGVTRGLEGFLAGDDNYYYRPIRPGDFIWETGYLYSLEMRKSQFSGQSLFRRNITVFANQRGELVAVRMGNGMTFGRQRQTDKDGHGERQKYARIKRAYYTPEDIKRIDADMDREQIRGANPRYWEDVNEGDELTPVVKGPLLVADAVAFDIGHGMAMYDGAHHLGYNYRKRHPAGFRLTEYGIPDVAEARHWNEKFGRQHTNVGAFNYGEHTYAWLCHLVTNWMGDDAWLYHIEGQWRQPIYNGDTNWVRGKVVRKYVDDAGQYKVDLEIYCQDQRGDITTRGQATVLLPSRVGGLPAAPPLDTPAPFKPAEVEVPIGKEPVWQTQLTF